MAINTVGGLLIIFFLPLTIVLVMFLCCYSKYQTDKEAQTRELRRIQLLQQRRQRQAQVGTLLDTLSETDVSSSTSTNNNTTTNHDDHQEYNEVALLKFFQYDTICKQQQKSKTHLFRSKPAQHVKVATTATATKRKPPNAKNDDDLEKGVSSASSSSRLSLLGRMRQRLFRTKHTNGQIAIPFDGTMTSFEEDEWCSICLEGYKEGEVVCTPKTGDCNHVFHKECLFGWVRKNHSECPLCRAVLIA